MERQGPLWANALRRAIGNDPVDLDRMPPVSRHGHVALVVEGRGQGLLLWSRLEGVRSV